jgi:ribonuclease BN (tRNA processing enzyme)
LTKREPGVHPYPEGFVMEVRILGCSAVAGGGQYVSTYLINGTVAIDAGCLGLNGSPEQQSRVGHVFLTHAHADHIAGLPFFIENVWCATPACPIVYGSSQTLQAIRRSIFNNEIWPDFVALSEKTHPFLCLRALEPEIPIAVAGLVITPVMVDHSIPTFAYIVREGEKAVVFAGDSAPTTRLWQLAREMTGVHAVFLEASFPNRMRAIADASMHLTSELFGEEAAKAPPGSRIIAVHMKVRYRDEIARELASLSLSSMEIGECEVTYRF